MPMWFFSPVLHSSTASSMTRFMNGSKPRSTPVTRRLPFNLTETTAVSHPHNFVSRILLSLGVHFSSKVTSSSSPWPSFMGSMPVHVDHLAREIEGSNLMQAISRDKFRPCHWLFPDHFGIPRLLQVFQVSGHPVPYPVPSHISNIVLLLGFIS